jgi:hypothetical protein
MGLSEYPLKRILNFKGLSVRPSIGYPIQCGCYRGRPIQSEFREIKKFSASASSSASIFVLD